MVPNNYGITVQVMAHPRRRHLIPGLLDKLGLDGDHVTWDERNNRWDTGRRAWRDAIRRGGHWAAVIQDDAVPCTDLIPGLAQALHSLDRGTLVCPFFGRAAHPQSNSLTKLITHVGEQALASNPSWISGFLVHGVMLAAPASEVAPMLRWCDRQKWPQYDKRIGKYFQKVKQRPALYTWPSMVDHRDDDSLVGHANGRSVWNFIGEDVSALDLDWSRGVASFPSIGEFRDH